MPDQKRAHKRIDKPLNISYSIADVYPRKWDMSVIKNISVGGVMFIAPSDLNLEGKTLQFKIKIPELAPHSLEVDAVVRNIKLSANSRMCEVGAQFINLSEENKQQLSIVEKMIQAQEVKNASNITWKNK